MSPTSPGTAWDQPISFASMGWQRWFYGAGNGWASCWQTVRAGGSVPVSR